MSTDTIASAVAAMLGGLADVARDLDPDRRSRVLASLGVDVVGPAPELDTALDGVIGLSDAAAALADAVAAGGVAAIVAAMSAAIDDLASAVGGVGGLDLTDVDATE